MPFVDRNRPVAFDAIGKMATKTVHPFPDRLAADHHPSLGEQVLNIGRAEREAMINSDFMGHDLTREAVAFPARRVEGMFIANP